MIKIYKESKPMTPNELAKWLIFNKGESAEYWHEMYDGYYLMKCITKKEVVLVDDCIGKQLIRLYKLFNCNKLHSKVFYEKERT